MITDEMLAYYNISYKNRPIDVCVLTDDQYLAQIIAHIGRDLPHTIIHISNRNEDRLSTLQQSKISVVSPNEEPALWESFAQGCLVFTKDIPDLENHIHYVGYNINDPGLLAYNLQRFLANAGAESERIARVGHEYVMGHYRESHENITNIFDVELKKENHAVTNLPVIQQSGTVKLPATLNAETLVF
jgi:hypothetical protein